MGQENIWKDLKKQHFKPVYWLEGEEEYFIDAIINYAEDKILTEAEAGFNLSIFYGRDANWADVINACRRYPMFAEKQVVILKEAQAMKEIEKLEGYIEKPLPSTLLFVAYKNKKLDGRTKLSKILKAKAEVFTSKKLNDNALPAWLNHLVQNKGYTLNSNALIMLIDHIGNDLSRLNNEIDKLVVNLGASKNITADDIEKYVGISKEFNVFELQQAVAKKDLYKAIRIIQYFEANPKAAPLQLIFPALYNFFSKVLVVYGVAARDEKSIAAALGVYPVFVGDYINAAKNFKPHEVEKLLLLLHQYNLKNVGVNTASMPNGDLLKEMVVKMITA